MKHIIYFIASAFVLFACDAQEEEAKVIKISGQTESLEGEVILERFAQLDKTEILEDGEFNLTAKNPEDGFYTFTAVGKMELQLYLLAGDSLHIIYDPENEDNSLQFSGDRAAENTFLRTRIKMMNELGINDLPSLMKMEYADYAAQLDSAFDEMNNLISKASSEEQLDEAFVEKEKAFLKYKRLSMDVMYPNYHAYFAQKSPDEVEYPKDELEKRKESVPTDRVSYLDIAEYEELMLNRLESLIMSIMERDSLEMTANNMYGKMITAADSLFDNQRMKDHFSYYGVNALLEYRGPVHSDELVREFLERNQTAIYKKSIEQSKEKWEPISPRKDVPDMTFTNIDGKEVKLSDLRGQLVYIDIWATWCGPCIAEHPYWDQLKEDYADQPIHFLTVSIDNTRDPWEKMVADKNMEGLQWFAEGAWKSELATHFKVNGIPRFLLLDEEGKIIDPSAERPSGKIRDFFDEQLKSA
ncbi:MAG: TlpA family protein disulfide reductase [Cyclobacteriaceae bacterium]|nr:TlpA family protein disulfide reductase [Cyclobacteriaceae bacterium]MCH8514819.1 TlpA family protein disulfide reductase [Cyclobacteriaceae bacterium]